MNKETLYELRSIVALYPYYQTARLLMLKNMYLLHETSFDEELRRAALYIPDRKVLFNLVEAAHYHIKTAAEKTEEAARENAKKHENEGNRTLSIIDHYLDSAPDTDDGDDSKDKPTPADAAIDYVAYLLKTESEEDRETAENGPQMKGQDLIDDFINKEGGKIQLQDKPTYTPETEDDENDDTETQNEYDEGYFTETLAKIYIKQGRYSKALEIIQRLNLNYPKKNAYFADQIRFLKKLIINENCAKKPDAPQPDAQKANDGTAALADTNQTK